MKTIIKNELDTSVIRRLFDNSQAEQHIIDILGHESLFTNYFDKKRELNGILQVALQGAGTDELSAAVEKLYYQSVAVLYTWAKKQAMLPYDYLIEWSTELSK